MATIKISIPNDYGSSDRTNSAIAECYDGDADAAAADGLRELYEALASTAISAGLVFRRATDYGAEWIGTPEQCQRVKQLLPPWAGISEIED